MPAVKAAPGLITSIALSASGRNSVPRRNVRLALDLGQGRELAAMCLMGQVKRVKLSALANASHSRGNLPCMAQFASR